MRRFFAALLLLVPLSFYSSPASAQLEGCLPGFCSNVFTACTIPPGPEATIFLARTSGLNPLHTCAYITLINGLVADSIWTKFDVLYIFATQNAVTANLNLVSTNYPAVPTVAPSSPAFIVDIGYAGALVPPESIHTAFIPSTAISPNFTQNSGHISEWIETNEQTNSGFAMGSSDGAVVTGLHARFLDDKSYFYINATSGAGTPSVSSIGHWLANRSTNLAEQGYKNGSQIFTDNANTSQPVTAREIIVAGEDKNGTLIGATGNVSMASIGSSLTSTDTANFYSRLRTYMTAVGVP